MTSLTFPIPGLQFNVDAYLWDLKLNEKILNCLVPLQRRYLRKEGSAYLHSFYFIEVRESLAKCQARLKSIRLALEV